MNPSEIVYTAGDNWYAILAAAAGIYAIGFVIYALVLSGLWLKLTGYTQEQLKPHAWKMAVSPVMPILIAVGLAILLKLAQVNNLAAGVVIAFQIWFFIVMPVRLYSFVYSPEKIGHLLMDSLHFLLAFLVAGAIIGGWR